MALEDRGKTKTVNIPASLHSQLVMIKQDWGAPSLSAVIEKMIGPHWVALRSRMLQNLNAERENK